jgi:hypothetical protein
MYGPERLAPDVGVGVCVCVGGGGGISNAGPRNQRRGVLVGMRPSP